MVTGRTRRVKGVPDGDREDEEGKGGHTYGEMVKEGDDFRWGAHDGLHRRPNTDIVKVTRLKFI